MPRYALFLDRDGVINLNTHYTHLIEDMQIYEDTIKFFSKLRTIDKLVPIVVSNQSGVAKGYYSQEDCLAFEKELGKRIFAKTGDNILLNPEYWYHSWSDDPDDPMRKPNAGMLLQACKDHNLEPGFIIGDKQTDLKAGAKAGCKAGYLVDNLRESRIISLHSDLTMNVILNHIATMIENEGCNK